MSVSDKAHTAWPLGCPLLGFNILNRQNRM